jgi:hypothetical protein
MTGVANIRHLFLEPKATYPLTQVATLLGIDRAELIEWVESGELETIARDLRVLPCSEVASFAMEFWSQETIEEALGSDVAELIPGLLRLTDLEVRIPRMQVVTLERLAANGGETVSAVLARELRDLVSVHSEWLSVQVPGFAEALHWPSA